MNPNVRRYGIIIVFGLIIVFSILLSIFIPSIQILGVDPLTNLEKIITETIYWIYALSTGYLLFLTATFLEKDERKFKSVKLLKINAILSYFFLFLDTLWMWIPSTIVNALMILLLFLAFLYVFSLYVKDPLLAISLIIVGVRNRKYYGNYLISGGILFLFNGIIYTILHSSGILVSISLISTLENLFLEVFYFSLFSIVSSLYSLYFLFFSIRIKNKFFMVWSILGLIMQFDTIFISLRITLAINTYFILLIFLLIIPFSVGTLMSMRLFELGKRLRRGLRVFISHSVNDFQKYRIEDVAKYLESQKGIGRVFYCETDLSGNIDEWMHKVVPRSNLLLFISSENSLESQDCKMELALAESNNLQVIPVLGFGLVWDDLKSLNLNRELGTSYDPMEFENFCKELYNLIIRHKETVETKIPSLNKKRTVRIKKK